MISTKNAKTHEGKELILGEECYAMDRGAGREESQILNYLKATGLKVGLLVNFGSHGKLEWRKFVN